MWEGMMVGGIILLVFGLVLNFMGFSFAFVLITMGAILIVAGYYLRRPPPMEPEDPTKKFCFFCLEEMPREADECPECGLKQPPK